MTLVQAKTDGQLNELLDPGRLKHCLRSDARVLEDGGRLWQATRSGSVARQGEMAHLDGAGGEDDLEPGLSLVDTATGVLVLDASSSRHAGRGREEDAPDVRAGEDCTLEGQHSRRQCG